MSSRYESSDLVFAIVSVAGATAACAARGDASTVETLARYYALVAGAVRHSEGRVVKVMGDGIVIVFPVSHASNAIEDLRSAQEPATHLWQLFDERCRVQVKVGIGSLISGLFGPPGQEREDVYGDALNQLFKLPAADFVVSPALRTVIGGE
jgi:class 3 adenylate cyclase